MKRIALIREDLCISGGCERVCVSLSNELSRYYDVYLINLYNNQSAYKINNNVNSFYLRNKKQRLRESLIIDIIKLRSYLLKNKFDVVLIIGGSAALQTFLATIKTNIKVIFCQHNAVGLDLLNKKSLKANFYRFILDNAIKFLTDRVVVLTKKRFNRIFY